MVASFYHYNAPFNIIDNKKHLMPSKLKKIAIGTRKSALAMWQTNFIAESLRKFHPDISVDIVQIVTRGDKSQERDEPLPEIGGKGLFTLELEEALAKNEIDIAVHSLKDLPTLLDGRFALGAIPKRAAFADVLISRNRLGLSQIEQGARIGTSSLRRASQLKRLRPDLEMVSIRGNVGTRIRKIRDPQSGFVAGLLAEAGLERLGLQNEIAYTFSVDEIMPAPGQGALGVQCRSNDNETIQIISVLHDQKTAAAVGAERSFLAALKAGCNTPVAAYACLKNGILEFRGRCLTPDGAEMVEVSGSSSEAEFVELGIEMAKAALSKGADKILQSYDQSL